MDELLADDIDDLAKDRALKQAKSAKTFVMSRLQQIAREKIDGKDGKGKDSEGNDIIEASKQEGRALLRTVFELDNTNVDAAMEEAEALMNAGKIDRAIEIVKALDVKKDEEEPDLI